MAKNDVVSHKVAIDSAYDWSRRVQPVEPPAGPDMALRKELWDPPETVMITGQLLTDKPYRSVGKMELKFDPLSEPLGASGWVVARRAFITAGHCVYHNKYNGWIYSAEFCPRFNLACPKTFVVETVYTLQGWIDDHKDRQYDLGACVVTELFTPAEPPLEFDANQPHADVYAAIGYPVTPTARHDFNGKRMWKATGKYIDEQNNVIAAENDLTGGASGGPWVEGGNGKAGGLTSRRPAEYADVALSPAFAEGFLNLYNAVKDF